MLEETKSRDCANDLEYKKIPDFNLLFPHVSTHMWMCIDTHNIDIYMCKDMKNEYLKTFKKKPNIKDHRLWHLIYMIEKRTN